MRIRECYWNLCMAGALWCGLFGSVPAEEPPRQPEIGLYEGAVAVDCNEGTATPLLLTNPQAMTDVRFRDVLARAEELTQLQVHVEETSLTDAGFKITPDAKIPEWPQRESIQQLLKRIPGNEREELTWVVEDGLITLMTHERAREMYTTKRYYVGDLVSADFSVEELIDILQEETSGPWDEDEQGTGTITPLGNHLFVRQTFRNQQEVQCILEALRRTEPIVLIGRSEEDLRLLRLYEDKRVSFDWPEITLQEFCQRLTELTGATFQLDKQALSDAGLDSDDTIVARSKNLPLSKALNLALSDVNGTEVTIVIEDGVFKITTAEKACEAYETVLFNVGSLGITGERLDEFVTVLERETSGPWDADESGTGTISLYRHRSSLIIRQTRRVQREILVLLRDLRTLPKNEPLFASPTDGGNPVRTKYYSMAPETAEALAKLIPESMAPGTWELEAPHVAVPTQTRPVYPVPIKPEPVPRPGRIAIVRIPEQKLDLHVIDPTRGQLPSELLEEVLPGKRGVATLPAGSYLAITHTREVHSQVVRLLKSLHRITPPTPHGGAGGGFFTIPARD